MLSPDRLNRVTWECVHFAAAAEITPALRQRLAEAGFALFELDGRLIRGRLDLFDELARKMDFPGYFGRNWDAVNDCLADLSWRPAAGYVAILSDANRLWADHLEIMGIFVELWLAAAECWAAAESIPFHLVFVRDASAA